MRVVRYTASKHPEDSYTPWMTEQYAHMLLGAMGKGNAPCDASKAAQAVDDLTDEQRRAVNFGRKLDRIAFRVTNETHTASVDREMWETTISRFRLLRAEEEQMLTWIYKHHPSEAARKQAYDLMMVCNQRMVKQSAAHFHRGLRTSGVEIDDLVGAGQQGLHEAMEQFDPARGYKFMTYAKDKVDMRIRRHVEGNDQRTGVRFPTGYYYKVAKVRTFMRGYEDEHGRTASLQEVMDHTGMDEDTATEAMQRSQARARSMQETIRSGDSEELSSFGHTLQDEEADVEVQADNNTQARRIQAAMSTLDARERAVVGSVFGYGAEPIGANYQKIAERYSMKVEEARALFKSGVAKMKDELADLDAQRDRDMATV